MRLLAAIPSAPPVLGGGHDLALLAQLGPSGPLAGPMGLFMVIFFIIFIVILLSFFFRGKRRRKLARPKFHQLFHDL
jgi:hypothetical protein